MTHQYPLAELEVLRSMPDHMTPRDFAEYTGYGVTYIYRLINHGVIPAVKVPTGCRRGFMWLIPVNEAEKWRKRYNLYAYGTTERI